MNTGGQHDSLTKLCRRAQLGEHTAQADLLRELTGLGLPVLFVATGSSGRRTGGNARNGFADAQVTFWIPGRQSGKDLGVWDRVECVSGDTSQDKPLLTGPGRTG